MSTQTKLKPNMKLEGDIRIASHCFKDMNMEPTSPEAARVIATLLSRFYKIDQVCAHHTRHEDEGFVMEMSRREATETFHYSLVTPEVCAHQEG